MPLQNSLQRFRLRNRARESVEDETVRTMQAHAIFNQLDDDLIGDQLAVLASVSADLHAEQRARVPSRGAGSRPDEVTGMPKCRVIISACVPLPEPGAPRSTSRLFT